MRLPLMTIVPRSMTGTGDRTMRALVMAQVGPLAFSVTAAALACATGAADWRGLDGARGLSWWPASRPPPARRRSGRRRGPAGRSARSLSFSFSNVATRSRSFDPVVVGDAVDVRALDDGGRAQRMAVPDDQVRVLADLDRADALVDAQLLRRVDRHGLERLVLGQPAVPHRLRRFHVQPPRLLASIGVDRDEHAALRVMSAAL